MAQCDQLVAGCMDDMGGENRVLSDIIYRVSRESILRLRGVINGLLSRSLSDQNVKHEER